MTAMTEFTEADHQAAALIHALITKHDMPGWLWKAEARSEIVAAFDRYAATPKNRRKQCRRHR
jgi:hypothetical protein